MTDLDPFTTSSPIEDINVVKGNAVQVPIPPLISNPKPSVEWYRDNQNLALEGPNHQITLDLNLVLLDAQLADDGAKFKATFLNTQTGVSSDTSLYTLRVTGKINNNNQL